MARTQSTLKKFFRKFFELNDRDIDRLIESGSVALSTGYTGVGKTALYQHLTEKNFDPMENGSTDINNEVFCSKETGQPYFVATEIPGNDPTISSNNPDGEFFTRGLQLLLQHNIKSLIFVVARGWNESRSIYSNLIEPDTKPYLDDARTKLNPDFFKLQQQEDYEWIKRFMDMIPDPGALNNILLIVNKYDIHGRSNFDNDQLYGPDSDMQEMLRGYCHQSFIRVMAAAAPEYTPSTEIGYASRGTGSFPFYKGNLSKLHYPLAKQEDIEQVNAHCVNAILSLAN